MQVKKHFCTETLQFEVKKVKTRMNKQKQSPIMHI